MKHFLLGKQYALCALLYWLALLNSYGQTTTVTVNVTDESGSVLPGVQVLLQGTASP